MSAWILALAILADPRPVWRGGGATHLGAPSPDGKWISCVDPDTGDLAVRETATGRMRRLTKRTTPGEFAYFSVISRDSAQVAYAWFNEEGYYDLRVIPITGGEPRVLFRSEESGFVQPTAWSPDGEWILTLLFRKDNISQIALVPSKGGEMRVLKSLQWVYPKKMDFSPDGRFLVYDNFARDGVSQRDIFVLPVDASAEHRLVEHASEDTFPVWSPGGGAVYFLSDRSGAMALWSVAVKDGRASSEPKLARAGLGRALPMGITRDGALFYAIRPGAASIHVAAWDAEAARFASRPDAVTEGVSPSLAPDAKRLAWLGRRGAENFGQESRYIVVRDVAAQKDTPLYPKLAHLERIRWTRDGRSLVASGSDGKGRSGLFMVDASTATVKPVAFDADAPFRGYPGVDTEHGIVYARGREIVIAGKSAHAAAAEITAVASDGRRVAFVEGASVKLLDAGKVETIGSGKEWRAIEWTGKDWLAAHTGGFTRLPSGEDAGASNAPVTAISIAGGFAAFAAGSQQTEIWMLEGLPR